MKLEVPKGRQISAVEGAMIISGTSVGAGILALPVASYDLGLPLSMGLLVVLGVLNMLSGLLIAETMLRTKETEHLPGLAKDYLGDKGALVMSAAIAFSIYGALAAYMIAGGVSLHQLSGGIIPQWLGSVIYFSAATGVVYGGMWFLKNAEKALFSFMILLASAVVLLALPHATVAGSDITFSSLPLAFGVMFFAYSAHQVIPTVGNAMRKNGKEFARAVVIGMSVPILMYITWNTVLVSAIPAIDMDVARFHGEPVTVPLGKVAGLAALTAGSLFALFSTFTSFAGSAYSMVDAMQDALYHWKHVAVKRWLVIICVVVPSLMLSLLNPGGFLRALDIAGFYGGGMLIGVFTPLIYLSARKNGDKKPSFTVPFGQFAAYAILIVFSAALLFKTYLIFTGWHA